MKSYLSAAELAEAELKGWPKSVQGVNKKARSLDLVSRPRKARGGGLEYKVASLPKEVQLELIRRAKISSAMEGRTVAKEVIATCHTEDTKLAQLASLPEKSRDIAFAKVAIILEFDAFIVKTGLSASKALAPFVEQFNGGSIPVEGSVKDQFETVSAGTLKRWRQTYRKDGPAALAPQYGNRLGDGLIDRDTELAAFIAGLIHEFPHIKVTSIKASIKARYGDRRTPEYQTLTRWVGKFREANERTITSMANPDKWNNKYRAASGSQSLHITRPNEIWQIDSTVCDTVLTDGRWAIVGVIDVYTRRFMMHVAKTSTARAISELLRRAILAWGVPEALKIDNGADYTSNHVQGILRMLEVKVDLSRPFSGWEKGIIERAFKTYQHDLVELLPGYCGHDVAERKVIEARKSFAERLEKKVVIAAEIDSVEFQRVCTEWSENIYLHNSHRGLSGKSPFDVANGYPHQVKTIADERALDVLLAPVAGQNGQRRVTKKGFTISGIQYDHPLLGACVGDDVLVYQDEADLGRVYCYSLDHVFICVAVSPFARGTSLQEFAAKKTEIQQRHTAIERANARDLRRKADAKYIYREILEDRAQEAGKLIQLPRRGRSHETHALSEAARAAKADDLPVANPSAAAQAIMDEESSDKDNIAEIPTDPIQHALALYRRKKNGDHLTEEDETRLELMQTSARFQTYVELEIEDAGATPASKRDG